MAYEIINLMGGEVYYYLNNKSESLKKEIFEYMIKETQRLVGIFNFFDKDSYLSILNSKREIKFQKEIAFLLEESLKLFQISKGQFNVFNGENILQRKKNKKVNSSFELEIKSIFKITQDKITLLSPKVLIDMGGIAKGYIIDMVLEKTIRKYGSEIIDILIDARGDMVCFGKNKKEVEIENPFLEEESFESIVLKKGSIITSGHNKQIFKGGSHIVGEKSDVLTISLKSEKKKCYLLDALGTYIIQLNSEEILEKIEFDKYYEDIECLLVLENGKILRSSFW